MLLLLLAGLWTARAETPADPAAPAPPAATDAEPLPRPDGAAPAGDPALDPALDVQAILQIEAQRLPPTALAPYVDHADPALRARAARALGRLRDPTAIAGLRRLLVDPQVEVRREAAFALGQTPGSADPALALLPDEPDAQVRALLLEALGKQAQSEAVPALLAGLHRGAGLRPTREAELAAVALGRLAMRDVQEARDPTVLAALVRTLRRMDKPTRRAAAFALARSGAATMRAEDRATVLAAADKDWDPVVRAFLVRAAAGLELSPEEQEALLQSASRDGAPGVRIACARAAAKVGWDGVVALLEDEDRGVRREAIAAIGRIEAIPAAEVLQPFVDRGATQDAAEDLVLTGSPALVEAAAAIRALAARDALADVDRYLELSMPERIRAAAVEALDAPERLLALAGQDGEGMVRTAAAMRLAELVEDPREVLPLLDAFDPVVAAIAAEHLAAHPVPHSEDRLVETLLEADNPDLLRATAQALTARFQGHPNPSLRRDTALDATLQELARHPDASVRAAAAELRSTLGLDESPGSHSLVSAPLDQIARIQGARVQTTRGEIRIDLLPEEAPLTVWNFAWLADEGFYDRLVIHRVVPDFVVQDGDPRGDGFGGPGWTIPDEINPLRYDTGVVGMALSGPDTGGSQWFVTLSPQPHLDGGYTVFGRVTSGMSVLRNLQPGDRILTVRIERAEEPQG